MSPTSGAGLSSAFLPRFIEDFVVTAASARALFFTALGLLAFGLIGRRPAAVREPAACDVYLAGSLSDPALLALSAAVQSREPPAVLLIDSPGVTPYTR